MRAGQQVHPHEWVALAKRVHLLEALALHHRNIETACRVVIANLKLILFLCVLFDCVADLSMHPIHFEVGLLFLKKFTL